jgi:hypothetical protein
MPVLPPETDALSWSKSHRQANCNINAVISAENDTLVQSVSGGVSTSSNITYDFDTDVAYIYQHEHDASSQHIMVNADDDTAEQQSYKARLQYHYYNVDSDGSDGVEFDRREGRASDAFIAPGLSQSSIPDYGAKAEPWNSQCVDCEHKCFPR